LRDSTVTALPAAALLHCARGPGARDQPIDVSPEFFDPLVVPSLEFGEGVIGRVEPEAGTGSNGEPGGASRGLNSKNLRHFPSLDDRSSWERNRRAFAREKSRFADPFSERSDSFYKAGTRAPEGRAAARWERASVSLVVMA